MKFRQAILTFLATLIFTSSAFAKPAPVKPLPPEQKAQIEQVIRGYLLKNPEILLEASEVLQRRQQEAMLQKAHSAIAKSATGLFKANSPTVGNAKGNVTVVEFFDYQCIHCKDMGAVMSELVKQDPNVRVVYKEFPIFGASSEFASKAALAANKQGKYKAFHNALLKVKEKLSDSKVMSIAKSVGLNTKQLKTDMNAPEIQVELKQNYVLAQSLGIMGTPAFIVASNPYDENKKSFFVPGATSVKILSKHIAEIRKS